jgi:hypothetical protein
MRKVGTGQDLRAPHSGGKVCSERRRWDDVS